MAGLDLDTILGGALGYLQSALGIDSPAGGGKGSAWSDYTANAFPALAGGGGQSNFPALAGGGGGASSFPVLAGLGAGQSNFPALAGSGGVSNFPNLAGGGGYLSQLAGQASQQATGAYNLWHPPDKPQPGPRPSAAPGSTVPGGGVSGGGSGGADDNTGLTGAAIDTWLTSTRPNAPIAGLGQYILDTANKYGVSAPLILGIALKESELGTTAGPGKILTGITDPALDQGLGSQRAFQGFSTWQEAIDATARNLATPLYAGKDLPGKIGTWYVGPQAFAAGGLDATDQAGNGSVRDYLNLVQKVYGQLGVGTQTGGPQPGPRPGGGTGMRAIWGGRDAPINQDFGAVTPGINQQIYEYGRTDFGTSGGHTGLDIGIARGTPLYSPFGGTVTIAGTGGFYRDEDYGDSGNTGQRGEIMIQLDNGDQVILGHTSAIDVRAGQRVNAGDLVGRSGSATGDHLHLEVRVRQPSGGYRIVDPRSYFSS